MDLELTYESAESIPDGFKELYTEKDGKHHLTGVVGLKTQSDVDYVKDILEKERQAHKGTKEKLGKWGDLDHQDVTQKLARVDELEIMASGNKDEFDKKLEELTEARIKSRVAPLELSVTEKDKTIAELQAEVQTLANEKVQRLVHDQIRAALKTAKTRAEAEDDILLLGDAIFEVDEQGKVITKENAYGFTPGISPEVWLTQMKDKRPHWWPTSKGGDAPGSGTPAFADNPWAKDTFNLTAQGIMLRDHPEKAAQMAKAAGVTLPSE